MLSRINITSIITDHFKTLRSLSQKSKRIYWQDFILFIGLPAIVASALTYKGYTLIKQVEGLIAAISIFGGFLFNLLAIVYSQMDKIQQDANEEKNFLKKKFVTEIQANISFCIVLSIAIVLALLLTTIDIPKFEYDWLIKKIIIGIDYFLLILFFLSLVMVLNRVYLLLKKNTETQSTTQPKPTEVKP
jgi:uncharacterized membrane protein